MVYINTLLHMLLFFKFYCLLIHLNPIYFYMLVIERLILVYRVHTDLRKSRPAIRNIILGKADPTPGDARYAPAWRSSDHRESSVCNGYAPHTNSAKRSITQTFHHQTSAHNSKERNSGVRELETEMGHLYLKEKIFYWKTLLISLWTFWTGVNP